MAVNADESKPLLVETEPSNSVEDVEKAQKLALVNKQLGRYRLLQAVLAAAVIAIIAGLTAGGLVLVHPDDYSAYEPSDTCLDVAIPVVLFELFVLYGVWRKGNGAFNEASQYATTLVLVIVAAKLWVFGQWSTRPAAGSVVGVAGVVSLLQFVFFVRATGLTATERLNLRWGAFKQILRPYFIPRGLRNKIFVVLTWIVLISSKVCAIYSPIVLGEIVTNLTATPPESAMGLISLYCFLNLTPSLLREVQDNLYVKVWQVAYAEVAETTFTHLHALSLEWHLKKRMGNIVRAMDRGMTGASTLMYYSMIYLFPAVGSAIAGFVVFALHFHQREIASVCFLAFGFYAWITFTITVWRRKFREAMNKHDNEMHDKASDSLINFEIVKCFTNEAHEVDHYISSVKEYQKGSFNTQASTSVLNVSQSTTIQLAMLGSLFIANHAVYTGSGLKPGEFVAIQAYVLTIFMPLSNLGMIYNSIINALVDIQNLGDILIAPIDVMDEPDAKDLCATLASDAGRSRDGASGVSVEFRDVVFKYPTASATQGLKGISFTVPGGTTTAIVGPTGSGKSTIGRLLFRFYDVDSGTVLVNGEDVRHCTQHSLRRLIGVVPQDTSLFNETIRYNIKYGRLDATEEEMIAAAQQARVHEFVMRNDNGYGTMCGERGLKLSGGEKQRIAIARCLLKNPPVVLLDEATSALDNQTEREVQKAMECLEGRTTIMIAHRLSTVQRADQIIVLKDGVIVERGTHLQLLATVNGAYAAMWNAQLLEDEAMSDV
jgi:ATP-binding cassette, subfamily B, heavy metal transporter